MWPFGGSHKKIKPQIGMLPKGEAKWMTDHMKSVCCHAPLLLGPRGGMSINCWCTLCHARFNMVFELIDWGQVTDLDDAQCPLKEVPQ